MLVELIGGSVAISAAQTVFWTQLSKGVRHNAPNLEVILHGGVRNFKDKVSGEMLDAALNIFNDALTKTFYVSTAAGAWPYAVATLFIGFAIPFGFVYGIFWSRRGSKRSGPGPVLPPRRVMHYRGSNLRLYI